MFDLNTKPIHIFYWIYMHRGIDKLKHKIVEFIKNPKNFIYEEMIEREIKDEQKKYAMRMINKLWSSLCCSKDGDARVLSLSRQTRMHTNHP